jgi:hypothetical protein
VSLINRVGSNKPVIMEPCAFESPHNCAYNRSHESRFEAGSQSNLAAGSKAGSKPG